MTAGLGTGNEQLSYSIPAGKWVPPAQKSRQGAPVNRTARKVVPGGAHSPKVRHCSSPVPLSQMHQAFSQVCSFSIAALKIAMTIVG